MAIIAAVIRIYLRIRHDHRLDIDDYFLGLAAVNLCASAGVLLAARVLIYVQVRFSLGLVTEKTPVLLSELLYYHKLEQTASVLLWISIFAVKFSFLFFFRNLIQRVRPLKIWWLVVVGITVVAACTCVPLGFIACPDFSSSFLGKLLNIPDSAYLGTAFSSLAVKCPAPVIVHRETIYLDTTVCVDVFTDLLIISIPSTLLWRVQIDLRRKIATGAVLGLSIVMIAIAIIRVALAPLPNNVTDTVWIFLWQFLEAATAIMMVSLTAIRSLFGRKKVEKNTNSRPLQQRYINMDTLDKSGRYTQSAEVEDAA